MKRDSGIPGRDTRKLPLLIAFFKKKKKGQGYQVRKPSLCSFEYVSLSVLSVPTDRKDRKDRK
jgi:hypothetical protein